MYIAFFSFVHLLYAIHVYCSFLLPLLLLSFFLFSDLLRFPHIAGLDTFSILSGDLGGDKSLLLEGPCCTSLSFVCVFHFAIFFFPKFFHFLSFFTAYLELSCFRNLLASVFFLHNNFSFLSISPSCNYPKKHILFF